MVRLYAVDVDNYVVGTDRFPDHVSENTLKANAEYYMKHYGAKEVWAMFQRKELTEAWREYCRDANKRCGIGDISRWEFRDYLRSGDWRIA